MLPSPPAYAKVSRDREISSTFEQADKKVLALLWQIYSRRCSLQIHFRQCGHRCGGGRAMSSRMAWRTAGKVGWGGGPVILFFPHCSGKEARPEGGGARRTTA